MDRVTHGTRERVVSIVCPTANVIGVFCFLHMLPDTRLRAARHLEPYERNYIDGNLELRPSGAPFLDMRVSLCCSERKTGAC